MQFNSYGFVLLFLPFFLLTYYTAGKKWRRQIIILGGVIFYVFAGWKDMAVLASSILITDGFARGMARAKEPKKKKRLVFLCILVHVIVLLCYKYWWVIPRFFSWRAPFSLVQPLGFSFFAFQQIMYILALSRGEIREHRTLDYLSYILYFPKLTMGPLAEPGEIIAQIRDPKSGILHWNNLAAGLRIFCFGMFKKMVLADTFAMAVNHYFQELPEVSSLEMALIMLSYTFQIYFDFSGYIDMAAGVSAMLNISLPLNFNSPYRAVSISDFWKRWHMTLTRFFTRNIYIPLGGNRKGLPRTCLNIMIVFLISGMWHGAHPNFLLWGCLNGLLLVLERVFRRKDREIPVVPAWLITFLLINCLWLLFRAGTIGQWIGLMRNVLSFQAGGLSKDFTDTFFVPELIALLRVFDMQGIQSIMPWLSVALFMGVGFVLVLVPQNNHKVLLEGRKPSMVSALAAAMALVWSMLCMSAESVFIYSGF